MESDFAALLYLYYQGVVFYYVVQALQAVVLH